MIDDVTGSPTGSSDASLASLGPLLDRLEVLLADAETLGDDDRALVFELLDGIDAVHRLGVVALARALGDELRAVRRSDAAIDWLFEAYGVGVDDAGAAEAALDPVRPYLHQHGGDVDVLGVEDGIVRVRLTGSCSGCTASSETLRHSVEEALREGLPGFVGIDVAPDEGAAPHPPPTPVVLQMTRRPT